MRPARGKREPARERVRRCRPAFLVALAVTLVLAVFGIRAVLREEPPPVTQYPGVVSIRGVLGTGGEWGGATGFLIGPGRVVTNWHVAATFDSAEIVLSSGKTYQVDGVIASDEGADIAVLSVKMLADAEKYLLPAAQPAVAGDVITIVPERRHSHPKPISGEVAAIRELPRMGRMIALYGSVAHGWSGSPLLDSRGDVVGMVSMGIWGQILAVPIDRVLALADDPLPLEEWASHQEPGAIEAWYLSRIGSEMVNAGELEEGLATFERAAGLRPMDWRLDHNRAACLHNLDRYEEAIPLLDRLIAVMPEAAEPRKLRAHAYDKLERYEEAAADLIREIELDPDSQSARSQLGIVYWRAGKYEDACRAFEESLAHDPDDAWTIGQFAKLLLELDRFDEANARLQLLLALEPDNAWAHRQVGFVLLQQERNDESLPSLIKATAVDPSDERAWGLLGRAYYRLKRYSEALETLARAASLDPEDPTIWYFIGRAHRGQGDWARAAKAFKAADRVSSPPDPDVLQDLVACLGNDGQANEALATARRFVDVCPEDARSYYSLGHVLNLTGNHGEALTILQRGIEVDADDSSLYFLRGDVYSALEQPEKAIESYQAGLQIEPDEVLARERLIGVLAKQGKVAEAMAQLRSLESLDAEAAARARDLMLDE